MNSWKNVLALAGLCLALSAGAFAQNQPAPANGAANAGQPRRGGGRRMTLAQLSPGAINFITPLTDSQTSQIKDIQTKLRADVKAAAGDQDKIKTLDQKAVEDVKGVLKPDQVTELQSAIPTLRVLSQAIPLNVIGDLKLTQDQATKIKALADDANTQIQAIPRADRRTKQQDVIAAFKPKVEDVLTADQKDTLQKHQRRNRRSNGTAPNPTGAAGTSK